MLAEIARPTIVEHYAPWNRDIAYRRLSAAQFVRVLALQAALGDDDREGQVKMFAELCAQCIVEPQATAQEWAEEATMDALVELGTLVLAHSAEKLSDEAKKN